jgi:hypothetical protein
MEATMDGATIEDAEDLTNAELPDATTFTLYIPDFVQQYSLSGKTLAQQNTELLQKDWLTPGLTHEIESLFPIASEINRQDDNKRDSIAFQRKAALLFPSGRMFASFKQIDQAQIQKAALLY